MKATLDGGASSPNPAASMPCRPLSVLACLLLPTLVHSQSSALPACAASLDSGRGTLSSGRSHVCVVSPSGGIVCWGDNSYGCASPPDQVASGQLAVSSGYEHTCALSALGTATCWGNCGDGRCAVAALNGGAVALSVRYASCALSVTGAVSCACGSATVNRGQCAVPAAAASGVVAVSTANSATCAVTSAGGVLCWGEFFSWWNGATVFYMPSTPPALTEVQVSLARGGGGEHMCALSAQGAMRCWGYNYNGQANVPNLPPAMALAAGQAHSCALASSGGVSCFGWSYQGQASPPGWASSGQVALSAGWSHTCTLCPSSFPTVSCSPSKPTRASAKQRPPQRLAALAS